MSQKRSYPEILFGRIAMMLDYISQTQLTECVIDQERSQSHKKLGMVMLEKGHINQEQLDEIIKVQQVNLQTPTSHPERRLEDSIMGRLIVRHGFATEEQVNEALRKQALSEQEGTFYRLGEVMVENGFMSVEDVLKVLKIQDKEIMVCSGCGARFNIASFEPGHQYRCKRCKTPLSTPAALESVQVDTTIFILGGEPTGDEHAEDEHAAVAQEAQEVEKAEKNARPAEEHPKEVGETGNQPRIELPDAQPGTQAPDGRDTAQTREKTETEPDYR